MMPCACAASRASAICSAICNASLTRNAPRAIRSAKRLAFDQLHHECDAAIRALHTIEVRDVRMVQRCKGLCLTVESGETFSIRRERLRQHFDGDLPAKAGIGGSIDFTHPAHADLGRDLVRAESSASG